ncbi:MAG TPA: phenylalanine--tRNA ligase subunit beta [Steroidobacteraceae bacterium]|nr:phenylalanine--tRNA ligase subunit beta [Steroidobacteraceae bacterium]
MRVSEQWLREFVNPRWDSSVLAHRLTMAGFEVESREPAAPAFEGVIVGEVLAVERHPDADKLSVCRVTSNGKDRLTIVCGARNVRPGLKTPLAMVGAKLPNDVNVGRAKLRGVESEGMLCSAKDLGLAEQSEGLLELPASSPAGGDVRAILKLDDTVFEVNVTPNRGDAMSMLGLAREVAVISGAPLKTPKPRAVTAKSNDKFAVKLDAPRGCPRLVSRVVRGVDHSARSPMWLQEKLRRAGLRSISPLVDVTNYVMLELGQPMHAYDLAKLQGSLHARLSRASESVTLLDGREIALPPQTLVIADEAGVVGIAGVMGGQRTAVSAATRDVLFEAAFFQSAALAGRTRALGLLTDASQRFERGVDWNGAVRAIERASELLAQIAGGSYGPVTDTVSKAQLPRARAIRLRRARITHLLGVAIPDRTVSSILKGLGLTGRADREGWRMTPPSHRFDLSIEEDLIEEVARVSGYDEIGESPAIAQATPIAATERSLGADRAVAILASRGYQEAITYSFIDPELERLFAPEATQFRLKNPIAENLSVMRASLWPGLVQALIENLRRQQDRVRLCEAGRRFERSGTDVVETETLAGVVHGSPQPEQWATGRGEAVDFYDVKGDIEAILSATGAADEFRFEPATRACLHPGRSARIYRNAGAVGWIGQLHPDVSRKLDLPRGPYVFELETRGALVAEVPNFTSVSRFPGIRRDLAVVVDESLPLAQLKENVSVTARGLLRELKVFDIYRGPKIEATRKSIALGLILQENSRTLTDQEADAVVTAVKERLAAQFGATIRDQ